MLLQASHCLLSPQLQILNDATIMRLPCLLEKFSFAQHHETGKLFRKRSENCWFNQNCFYWPCGITLSHPSAVVLTALICCTLLNHAFQMEKKKNQVKKCDFYHINDKVRFLYHVLSCLWHLLRWQRRGLSGPYLQNILILSAMGTCSMQHLLPQVPMQNSHQDHRTNILWSSAPQAGQ